ncbi:MAG TPA: ABC transporter ATP-binding protein [Erysipelothrix sp.]|nr:ABC transporter ATP-binding protein [Erysipelothrix sp.]
MSVINIEHVNKKYGKHHVLNDVNLSLDNGKIVGLCGPNGAGKTTLIKMVAGLLRSYSGKIEVNNHPIGGKSKAMISYLPDLNYFNTEMNSIKAKKLYIDMYHDFDEEKFDHLLNDMKLDPHKPLSKMSKGMKEKFQLALCLSRQAEIYLIDEPIAGVDPASRDLIIETILSNYNEDALMLISTHIISDIEPILDEVIFINEGRITLHDNCDVLREETGLSINELFIKEFSERR